MNGAFCNFREDWASEFLCDQGRKVVFRVVPRYSYRTVVLQYWVLSDVLVPVRYSYRHTRTYFILYISVDTRVYEVSDTECLILGIKSVGVGGAFPPGLYWDNS